MPVNINHPPVVDLASPYCVDPQAVLKKRRIKKGNKIVSQLLKSGRKCLKTSYLGKLSCIETRFPTFFVGDKDGFKGREMMQINIEAATEEGAGS